MEKIIDAKGRGALPGWPYLVRDFRLARGESVVGFAGLYGVTRQTVYNWEWGKVPPPAPLAHDILGWALAEQRAGRGFDA